MNIETGQLTTYVAENQNVLLNDVILGSDIVKKLRVQTGIKTKERIHYLATAPEWQDGMGCGFNPLGTAELTEREIETGLIKVDMEFCPDTLLATYKEYLVKIAATENKELPFANYLLASITGHIKEDMEKAIFYGDKASGDSKLNKFDGILKIAGNDSTVINVTAGGTSAYDDIMAVYMALPEETLRKGASILVSPAVYRKFLAELVQKNLYHYSGPQNAAPSQYVLPGTDVPVIKETGLSGNDMIGAHLEDIVFGCDKEGDSEKVLLWVADDGETIRLKIRWNAGVNYAFGNQIVIGK